MKNPALVINLEKIEKNAKSIVNLCKKYGIQVAGVTKVTCAIPEVGKAMLKGGCYMLADSRIENLKKLRESGINDIEFLLLRLPMISDADETVKWADMSLNSEISTIKALNEAAKKQNKEHKIILMIDVGDLREGIWPDKLDETIATIKNFPNIIFEGIGCNLACYGGVIPSEENMNLLLEQKKIIEEKHGLTVNTISGGNSSGLFMLYEGRMPDGINQFRVGEAIMLGRNVIDRSPFPETYQDTFKVRAEIIELKEKPSVPIGNTGQDAFGNEPEFIDKGIIRRAILALGRQDIVLDGLTPLDKDIEILGASSDHLILDVTNSKNNYKVGDTIDFYPGYGCLLAASTSNYVDKIFE